MITNTTTPRAVKQQAQTIIHNIDQLQANLQIFREMLQGFNAPSGSQSDDTFSDPDGIPSEIRIELECLDAEYSSL